LQFAVHANFLEVNERARRLSATPEAVATAVPGGRATRRKSPIGQRIKLEAQSGQRRARNYCRNALANSLLARREFRRRPGIPVAVLMQAVPVGRHNAKKEIEMNIIIWLVVGGLIGWVASMMMRTDGQQGMFLNIVVGIVGAALGGWLISPLVGVGTINQGSFSIGALVVSLLGAVVLLAIVNLFRRGSSR